MHKFACDEQFLSNFAACLQKTRCYSIRFISVFVSYGIFAMVERPVYDH